MSDLENRNNRLRFAVEYGPLIVFFITYYISDLFVATASIMIATALALALSYLFDRYIPTLPVITACIIGVFGGLTLWLQDETFIKMKPTIIQAIFGTVLIAGLVAKRLFLKSLMGAAWHLTDEGWKVLTIRFAVFFFVLAILNEVVWRTQSTEVWVNFKVWGLLPISFLFVASQIPLINKYRLKQ